MKKSMTLSYEVGKGLYLNITNKCPCNCTFCIRNNGDGAYGSDPLWLERQPSAGDIIEDLRSRKLDEYDEIVFCGYGEPTCELEILKETARYIRSVTNTPIRINTNGLSDLINKRSTAEEFEGIADTISISLNASDAEAYDKVTRPSFKGVNCFEEMLGFAGRVKNYVPNVMLTVVDIIGEEEIKKSQEIADKAGIRLRVREYIDQ
ncbi:TIGR04100 family radical SAM protein [Ruminococcus sp. Marseille-P6503]|uniref:TIGR04100 family radical SAM protein n=1 Tax=Ruminococcus sp. Marseille-P6503 TaxID=2364796 RepID=UPI000F540CC8|nr:TIGR04100 family radical SAM protein [Ruminococcus sp. Marseille-P6503]